MYIGKAAQLSGTTVKSIRHYEEIGLLPVPKREGKYRIYSQQSVEVLTFIKCAQQLGFKLKELQVMLNRYDGEAFRGTWRKKPSTKKKPNWCPRSALCSNCTMASKRLKAASTTLGKNASSSASLVTAKKIRLPR